MIPLVPGPAARTRALQDLSSRYSISHVTMVQHLLWDNAQLRQTLNDYAVSYIAQVHRLSEMELKTRFRASTDVGTWRGAPPVRAAPAPAAGSAVPVMSALGLSNKTAPEPFSVRPPSPTHAPTPRGTAPASAAAPDAMRCVVQ